MLSSTVTQKILHHQRKKQSYWGAKERIIRFWKNQRMKNKTSLRQDWASEMTGCRGKDAGRTLSSYLCSSLGISFMFSDGFTWEGTWPANTWSSTFVELNHRGTKGSFLLIPAENFWGRTLRGLVWVSCLYHYDQVNVSSWVTWFPSWSGTKETLTC